MVHHGSIIIITDLITIIIPIDVREMAAIIIGKTDITTVNREATGIDRSKDNFVSSQMMSP